METFLRYFCHVHMVSMEMSHYVFFSVFCHNPRENIGSLWSWFCMSMSNSLRSKLLSQIFFKGLQSNLVHVSVDELFSESFLVSYVLFPGLQTCFDIQL